MKKVLHKIPATTNTSPLRQGGHLHLMTSSDKRNGSGDRRRPSPHRSTDLEHVMDNRQQ